MNKSTDLNSSNPKPKLESVDRGLWTVDKNLNCVGKTGECKVSDFHRRNHVSASSLGLAHCFNVIEHDDRALVEAEVFHREFDLTVFDVESTVAG